MPNQKKHIELKVGIMSLSAIVLLVIGLMLGNDFSFSSGENTVEFRFDNAGGLQVSEPVFISGVEMGKISKIRVKEDYVLISAELSEEVTFYSDASARILIKEITGGKKIDVELGGKNNNTDPLPGGEPIEGQNTPDFGELVAIVGSVSQDVVSLIRKLDTLASSFNILLADTAFSSEIRHISSGMVELVDNANNVFSGQNGLRATLSNANDLIASFDTLIDKNSEDVTLLLQDLRSTFSTLDLTLTNANSTLSSFDPVIKKMDELLSDLRREGGLFHKISNDTQLSKDLEELISEILLFVKQAKQHGINVNASLGSKP